jgi:tRNA pseudouridine32 synthase / 23S rRNA pseudouridine746 synthase
MMPPDLFHPLDQEADSLPERFTFPFHYEPHPLARRAAAMLQQHLESQTHWKHDFEALGKMFGVLIVQNTAGQLGYLAAFSGKLADQNHLPGFVPPVFDLLDAKGFFKVEEAQITQINHRICALESAPDYADAQSVFQRTKEAWESRIAAYKQLMKAQKATRDARRGATADAEALEAMNHESAREYYYLKDLKRRYQQELAAVASPLATYQQDVEMLKIERKRLSAALQQKIFDHYGFLNQALEHKSLGAIFGDTGAGVPPAGAGECAAPKLLQYAFLNGLRPVALAEFWWGTPPATELRQQGQFYPACRGKCLPILGHMLAGMDLDPDPMALNPAIGKELAIVWEDEYLVVVAKPHDFFSVPGKRITDSVQTRMKARYPDATGPMLVHRLDVATSGLLVVAKSLGVYQQIQHQFTKRKVKKRYVALLEGIVAGDSGSIELPLRGDLDDRPRQMVCYEQGKPALTHWRVIARMEGRTKVEFTPVTGRTHQLRVHAAHASGLQAPIVGDDLYGTRAERLYLHAERIEFEHPVTGTWVVVEVKADF